MALWSYPSHETMHVLVERFLRPPTGSILLTSYLAYSDSYQIRQFSCIDYYDFIHLPPIGSQTTNGTLIAPYQYNIPDLPFSINAHISFLFHENARGSNPHIAHTRAFTNGGAIKHITTIPTGKPVALYFLQKVWSFSPT